MNKPSRMLRPGVLRAWVMALFLAVAGTAGATSEILQGLSALTRGSHHVAFGKVVSVETRKDPATRRVTTHVHFAVIEMIKGQPADSLELVQRGGEIDGAYLGIEGMPRFEAGEELVVFTYRDRRGFEGVNGIQQGWYPVRRDSLTQERFVEGLPVEAPATLVRAGESPRPMGRGRESMASAFGRIRAAGDSLTARGHRDVP